MLVSGKATFRVLEIVEGGVKKASVWIGIIMSKKCRIVLRPVLELTTIVKGETILAATRN